MNDLLVFDSTGHDIVVISSGGPAGAAGADSTVPGPQGDPGVDGAPWAMLAYAEHVTDMSTSSQYPAEVDVPGLSFTLNLDGSPVFVDCMAVLAASTQTSAAILRVYRDGSLLFQLAKETGIAAGNNCFRYGSRRIMPTVGPSTFTVKLSATGGATATLAGSLGAAWIGVRTA